MFNYFTDIIIFIFLGFAIIYPLFLWITPLKKIDSGFYRFNLGMCCVVGALGITALYFLDPSLVTNIYVWIWFGALMIVTALYWNSTDINNMVITAISLFGMGMMIGIVADIVHEEFLNGVWFVVLLGSAITAHNFSYRVNPLAMPCDPWQVSRLSPSSISIHYYGNMCRHISLFKDLFFQ